MVVPVLDYVRLCSKSSDFVFTPDEKRLKCYHTYFGLGVTKVLPKGRILSKDGPDCTMPAISILWILVYL